MEKVIHPVQQKDEMTRLPVLRLELDYELMTLHDAMVNQDTSAIKRSKLCLARLREEWIQLTQ
ncbi:hypothetical protein [Alkalicoccobacillus porphyridii]|uniref:Uncharacterized protein n=1 Tax=Alkalicoccobacillus porphyridii TaxID=2597270 RepID=A0A553ZUY2_9BACI|nr:hypothetical protein [Alkalicoccobacillus porphyridii]TSB45298.1 hypothetical protein FN960_16480 [Alkalicoccobacillus porphyridii]